MANNYCEASFAVQATTEEREIWQKIVGIATILLTDYLEEDEKLTELQKEEYDPVLIGQVRAVAKEFEDWGTFDVNFDEDGDSLWFHHDESFNMDQAAAFLSLWLKLTENDKSIVATWANTCSKPRVDEFGGGAVVITAKGCHWFNSEYLASCAVDGLCLPSAGGLMVEAENVGGWNLQTSLSVLCEFIDENPHMRYALEQFVRRKIEDGFATS